MNLIYRLIKFNRIIRTHRFKYFAVLLAHVLGLRHLFLRLDPVEACNLKCLMCRTYGDEEYRKHHSGTFTSPELHRIARLLFSKALHISFGCIAEPTMYEDLPGLVNLAKEHGIPYVSVATNGQLLTETTVRKLLVNHLNELIISIHGVNRETYEHFMVGASYEKLHALLGSIAGLRRQGLFDPCRLRLNYVVNSENLEELGSFFAVFGNYNFDILQIRPMIAYNYRGKSDLSGDGRYQSVLESVRRECAKRNILLLAEKKLTMHQKENYFSLILPAIYRYISPGRIWNDDFHWQTETYRQYCRKKQYTRFLIKAVFSKKEKLISQVSADFIHSLKYNIM